MEGWTSLVADWEVEGRAGDNHLELGGWCGRQLHHPPICRADIASLDTLWRVAWHDPADFQLMEATCVPARSARATRGAPIARVARVEIVTPQV